MKRPHAPQSHGGGSARLDARRWRAWACAVLLGMPVLGWSDLASARAALDEGRFYDVLQASQELIAAQPVAAHELRGEAYAGLKEIHLALGEYQRGLSHSPENVRIVRRIASLLIEQQRIGEATAYLERGYELEPNNATVARRLMELYQATGDAASEIALGERALQRIDDAETVAWIRLRLGHLLYAQTAFDRARPYLESSAQDDAASTTTLYVLADVYKRAREHENTLATVDRALRLDRNDDRLIKMRGDVLMAMDRDEEAYKEYWKLNTSKSPLWSELSQTIQIATAGYHRQIPAVVASQYGIVMPLSIAGGLLTVLLLLVLLLYIRNRE